MKRNKIYCMHVLEGLKLIPDGTIQTVVTSPPYWGLRDYGLEPSIWGGDPDCRHEWGNTLLHGRRGNRGTSGTGGNKHPTLAEAGQGAGAGTSGQFCSLCGAWRGCYGLEPTPEMYVEHTVLIFREVWRVLRDDGTLWLNLGDSYANDTKWGGQSGEKNYTSAAGGYGGQRLKRETGLKPKDLVGIPWRVAFALQGFAVISIDHIAALCKAIDNRDMNALDWFRAGFRLWEELAGMKWYYNRSDIIWHKLNPMPESVTDRPTKAHEYIFLLTKSGTPQYWTHRDGAGSRVEPDPDYRWINTITEEETAVEPPEWRTAKAPDGSKLWKRINLWQGHDYFYDAEAVREPGAIPAGTKAAKGSAERFNTPGVNSRPPEYKIYNGTRNRRSVWTIATQPFPGAHFATFPPKLIEPCILAGTSPKACEVCGAPWERMIKREGQKPGRDRNHGGRTDGRARPAQWENGQNPTTTITTGWQPTCSCPNEGKARCLVLDPFIGSGTTALKALEHGRDFTGIEISELYARIADLRIEEAIPRFEQARVEAEEAARQQRLF